LDPAARKAPQQSPTAQTAKEPTAARATKTATTATATPTPTATATPTTTTTPTATATPTATTTPITSTAGPASTGGRRDGILLSQEELMVLPTSGPGWKAIMARVQSPYGGSYTLGVRDKANKDVLANALAGARLGNAAYKAFVRDKIAHMMAAPRNANDLLATLRQLQTYIVSADLIDLASFDPALDAKFRPWLAQEVRYNYTGDGGGGSVISNHDKKPNNWGTHAGTTRLAAALYLGDDAEFRAARDVWYGYTTGDSAYLTDTTRWTGTTWQCNQNRPAGINPKGCTRDGRSLDGVIPEDQRRCGEYSWPACETNYIHGATDGISLAFWIMDRQGEDPWSWGDQAALRQMQWKYANNQVPYSGFRWQIPVIEKAYGIDLAGNDPAATSTNFGYADWWTQ
jgi:hypothetical protein